MKKSLIVQFGLLTAVFAIIAGCIPVDIVWMPDSHGYLYISDSHDLMYRNVTDQKDTKIVALDWLNPLEVRPAVSPDGKTIVLGKIDEKTGSTDAELTLAVVNKADGSVSKVTKPWKLRNVPTEDKTEGVRILEWVATKDNGNRLIIGTEDETAICKIDGTQWQQWDDVAVPFFLDRMEANVDIAVPDGRGFIATQNDPADPLNSAKLVNWSGEMKTLKVSEDVQNLNPETFAFKVRYMRWDGPNLKLAISEKSAFVVVDCDKLTVSIEKDESKSYLWKFITDDTDTIFNLSPQKLLRLEKLPPDDGSTPEKDDSRFMGRPIRVEVVDVNSGEAKEIVAKCYMCICFASPDNKRMVISYYPDKDNLVKQNLLTINADGKTIDDFQRTIEENQ